MRSPWASPNDPRISEAEADRIFPANDEIVEELHALPTDDDGVEVFRRLRDLDPVRYRAEIAPIVGDLFGDES